MTDNNRFSEVKSLLRKHDYVVILQGTPDGCIVTYPHPRLIYPGQDQPRLVQSFRIQRGNEPGFWVHTTVDEGSEERFFGVPEYAMRIYIICEITACCYQLPLHPELRVYVDAANQERPAIEDVIPAPSSEVDRKKEAFLQQLIVSAREDGFPPIHEEVATTHGVGDGYKILRQFFD